MTARHGRIGKDHAECEHLALQAPVSGGGGGGVIIPPAPPIDQNPNDGTHPVPAPARPTPKPDWKTAAWRPGRE
ncbi:hypothetical protein [Streptomyces sp. NPDC088246]|uniref:hypothetical protein n=1 Tax=Streptomyces sp. NPDC088246 TaxID=3365842 RepID=UPI0037F920A0